MILFLHNRYRTTGGEERAVSELLWLVREHMGEEAELLERSSDALGRAATHRDGALSLLTGLAANRSFETGLPVRSDEILQL